MKHYRSTLTLVCVTLACMAMAGEVCAETDRMAEGRAHFSRGVEYYKDEDYRNAMVEFKRAYELAPNYKLLYNLSQTAQELKDYAFALQSLERYLADGGSDIAAERRTEVQATIRKLKQRVSEVTISSNASNAEVFVDDVPAGRTPLSAALVVSAGHRKISVTKGTLTTTRLIEVAGGERTELTLDLVREEPSAAGARPGDTKAQRSQNTVADQPKSRERAAAAPPSQAPRSSNPTWIGVVATGVFAVAAGVTGGFALAAKRDFDATLDRYPISPGDVSEARDKTRKLALATDILGGAAVLSCAVTVWMALSHGRSEGSEASRVGVTLTPTGLTAHGRF